MDKNVLNINCLIWDSHKLQQIWALHINDNETVKLLQKALN